jgi:hypothetical protein
MVNRGPVVTGFIYHNMSAKCLNLLRFSGQVALKFRVKKAAFTQAITSPCDRSPRLHFRKGCLILATHLGSVGASSRLSEQPERQPDGR